MKLNSELISNGFFGVKNIIVPNQLEPEMSQNDLLFGTMIFVGLLLFAMSRVIENNYIKIMVTSFIGLSTDTQLQKVDLRLASLSSVLLTLSYLITYWACWSLLIFSTFNWPINDALATSAAIVLFFTCYPLIGVFFTSWISGEWSKLKDLLIQNMIGIQFISLIYFLIALIWFLNPLLRVELFYIFIISSITHLVIRWIKGIIVSLLKGIPIYYIILYFCTLEILPIFVAYYITIKNFNF